MTLILFLYVPIVHNYVTGCVTSNQGTFVTHNLNSVALNYVTMQGDSARVIVSLVQRVHCRRSSGSSRSGATTARTCGGARKPVGGVWRRWRRS